MDANSHEQRDQPRQATALHVRAAGAAWDHKAKLWRLPKRIVGLLRLTERIAPDK